MLAAGKENPYLRHMIFSRISSKAQTTLPRAIRLALGLKEGDRIAYAIEGDRVILTRADAALDDPFAGFSEWHGEEDAKAFADL